MSDLITPVFQAFQDAPSESEIIGNIHPLDMRQPWIDQGTYQIYWAIGRAFRPQSCMEIGVRFGYSMLSMARGSEAMKSAYGFDCELDVENSLKFADSKIRRFVADLHLTKADTQTLARLDIPQVDLAHVDGQHTYAGVRHDCGLAMAVLKPGGLLIIDDVSGEHETKWGADFFCLQHGLTPQYLPCRTGMYLVRKPA